MTARSVRHQLAGLLVVMAAAGILSGWTFFGPVVPLDEGIVLVYPGLINHGLVPNRDFASLYTPGDYCFLAGVFRLFGASIGTERIVGFFYVVALQYAVWTMTLSIGVLAALMLVVASNIPMQIFPDAVGAYAWFGGLALAVWSVVTVTRPGAGTRVALLTGACSMDWRCCSAMTSV